MSDQSDAAEVAYAENAAGACSKEPVHMNFIALCSIAFYKGLDGAGKPAAVNASSAATAEVHIAESQSQGRALVFCV